jgi:hypothetical protein
VLLEAVLLKGIDVDVVMQHYLPVGGCMIDFSSPAPLVFGMFAYADCRLLAGAA